MNKKIIELKPLYEIGTGMAQIDNSSVNIEVKGINGALKAWLIGGEATAIGNLVDGKLRKDIDTTKNTGILITQSGRQLLIGNYAEEKKADISTKNDEEPLPFKSYGFNWRKIIGKKFETDNLLMKYILSNKAVYESFKTHKHYFIGGGENCCALALPCGENEDNPLRFLGQMIKREDGYIIVCIDEKTGKLYLP